APLEPQHADLPDRPESLQVTPRCAAAVAAQAGAAAEVPTAGQSTGGPRGRGAHVAHAGRFKPVPHRFARQPTGILVLASAVSLGGVLSTPARDHSSGRNG